MAYKPKPPNETTRLQIVEALNLDPGQAVWIPVEGMEQAKTLQRMLIKDREKYAEYDPLEANRLTISIHKAPRVGKLYVVITKSITDPSVGFVMNEDGTPSSRAMLAADKKTAIRIIDMFNDGYTPAQIAEKEGISEADIKQLLEERRRE